MCCRTRRPALTEGDPGAIRAGETSAAGGAYAGPWRQRHRRRDRFRHRRQASGTREFDRGRLRCARQQGRPACPRHRRCRRDRGACAADGQRAGGADPGDPRFRRGAERRGKHLVRDPQGPRLRGRARRADRQYELCRPEGCADRARHRRGGRQGHRDGGRRRQCRSEIAAALSRRQCQRDRGQRHRCPGQAVRGLEPRQLYRASPRPASTSSCRRPTKNTR